MMMTTNNTNNRSVSTPLNDNINASSPGGSCDGGGNGSSPSSSTILKKGPWTAAEDAILMEYVKKHGEGNWNAVQKNSGLSRCGKSCRLRWANHLRPNLKKGSFSPDEERLILELHSKLGNKWARMAAQLPGRTDNEIKNYWNTRVKRRQRAGLPLYPNNIQKSSFHHHHHHHHQHQQTSVLNHQSLQLPPPQFSSLSSSQHQKTNFGSASLPPFDPLNLSTQTQYFSGHQNNNFLSTSINGFKRFRAQNFGFSHQFSPTQHQHQTSTPSSSVLFNHNLSSQYLPPPPPPLQFNQGNYDFMSPPPPLMQTNYHDQSNHMSPPAGSPFSFKLELPSNQMPQPADNTAASGNTSNDIDFKINTSGLDDQQSNSGLLDALLQEAQAMGRRNGGHDSRKERLVSEQEEEEKENCRRDGLVRDAPPSGTLLFCDQHTTTTTPPSGSSNQWDESSPANSSIGMKKKNPTDEINSMEDDDLSSLLDIIPSTMLVSEFYNDGGEISNGGQSSGVTDEDIGLDMQLLPSNNTNTTTTTNNTNTMENDWSLGAWNNEPEMC